MKEIIYLNDTDLDKLAKQVNKLLNSNEGEYEGEYWQIHGTVVVNPPIPGETALYIQAMVR